MQIVINISDKAYEYAKTRMALFLDVNTEILKAVENGTPLPIADIEALRSRIIDAVHSTICTFFEPVPDDSEAPMTPFDSRLLAVNKEICNRIREVFEVYGRKEREQNADNTWLFNAKDQQGIERKPLC